jgi:hypothetical protein
VVTGVDYTLRAVALRRGRAETPQRQAQA